MNKASQLPIPGFEVSRIANCSECGRRLVDPKSIKAGAGPVCSKKRHNDLTVFIHMLRQEHHNDYVEMLNRAADQIERMQKIISERSTI